MTTIFVERTIAAPIEQVFAAAVDHERYHRFPGIRESRLLKTGTKDKNGVGAQREIKAGSTRFVEDIVAYDEPHLMEYLIVETNAPFIHKLGQMKFIAVDGGTRVEWTSIIQMTIPVIGFLFAGAARKQGEKGFSAILKTIERELAA